MMLAHSLHRLRRRRSSAANVLANNLRFRWHMNEGRDVFLVYNEQLNTELSGLNPVPPRSQDRALLLKFVYALSP
jgi:hypothetical protein